MSILKVFLWESENFILQTLAFCAHFSIVVSFYVDVNSKFKFKVNLRENLWERFTLVQRSQTKWSWVY
jgi:hypothetical protein